MNTKEKLVTLETLEPGDKIVLKGTNHEWEVIDFSKDKKIVFLRWGHNEPIMREVAMLKDHYFFPYAGHAHPSPIKSAPAEKEGKWWKSLNEKHGCQCGDEHPYSPETVEKIVAEAKRRGAEEAWKGAIEDLRDEMRRIQDHTDNGLTKEQYAGFLVALNMLENRLDKPAGAGEK